MTSRLGRWLLALPLLIAGVAVVTSPANAEQHTTTDASHDVREFSYKPEGGLTSRLLPSDAHTDVIRAYVRHGNQRVVLRLRVRDMEDRKFAAFWRVRTEDRRGRGYLIRVDNPVRGGAAPLEVSTALEGCPGIKAKVRPGRNLARVSVPRSCLGEPRWIRVGVAAGSAFGSGAEVWREDDAGRRGQVDAPHYARGPRLTAG